MRFVVAAAIIACTTSALAARPRKPPEPLPPSVELVSINTKEHYLLQPDAKGNLTKKQLKGWNHFMRCWHTGRVHAMNPRLAKLLYEIGRHYEKTLIVYDGYRAPWVAKQKGNTRSPHKKGIACDFKLQLDGEDEKAQREMLKELRDYLYTTYDGIGVGYYPNSTFVHLDVRPRGKAFWVDYSYPGQKQSKAFYAKKTWEQLKEDEAALSAAQEHESQGGAEPQIAGKPGVPAPNTPTVEGISPENP